MPRQVSIVREQVRQAIQDEYADVAACPLYGFHFTIGRAHAVRPGYPSERVVSLPDEVSEIFRVLKPSGRYQFSDIIVGRAVPTEAKSDTSR